MGITGLLGTSPLSELSCLSSAADETINFISYILNGKLLFFVDYKGKNL